MLILLYSVEKHLSFLFQHPFFRFVVGSNRVIFMLRDGSYAWEIKDFLIHQERCEDVTVEGQVFPGKAANKANKANKEKEQNETKKKDKNAANRVNKSKQELWEHWYRQGLWSRRKGSCLKQSLHWEELMSPVAERVSGTV